MDYLPVFLQLSGRRVLLVGGGAVAARKFRLLNACGAEVRVVAPSLGTELEEMRARGALNHRAERFAPSHLDGVDFVVAATNDHGVNVAVAEAARARHLFVNAVDDAAAGHCLMPAIIDRSPLIVAVSSGGASPSLARSVRTRIEALLPEHLGALTRLAGRWRQRVQAALPDLAERRRFWDRWADKAFAGESARGDAAVRDTQFADALAAWKSGDSAAAGGAVWLIGAGPGDPDLLTLRALQLLSECDVVMYDRLVPSAVLDRVRRDAERIFVGKESGQHRTTQERINRLLLEQARAGKRVARLKGGDPLVFARGGEELAVLLAAGIPVTIVPGVTAASGAAAVAGISLTHRGLSQAVSLVTAMGEHTLNLDWRALAAPMQTTVFYMGVAELPRIVAELIAHGAPPERALAIVERATLPGERVLRATLASAVEVAQAAAVAAPALLIVGEVAGYARASTASSTR